MEDQLEILIIDDNALDREMVRRALQQQGRPYHLAEAETARAGEDVLSRRSFDCAFLDYRLPETTALEILKTLQGLSVDTPIVIITGCGDEALAADLMRAGAADYLSKQRISPELIGRSLENALEWRDSRRRRREDEERYRLLIEGAKDFAIFMISLDSHIATWNSGAEKIFGYTEDEIVTCRLDTIFSQEDAADGVPARELSQAAAQGAATDNRWLVRKDGGRFWAEGVVTALHDKTGRLRGYEKVVRDATESKRHEQDLQYQLRLMNAITSNAADALFLIDHDCRVRYMNPAAEALTGWSRDELTGKVLHDAIHHHRRDGSPYPLRECPLGGLSRPGETIKNHEDHFIRRDGSFVPVSCSSSPIVIDGHVAGTVLAARDITEKRQTEARQRTFLRDVLKSVTDGKLLLCDSPQDLPERLPEFAAPIDLTDPGAIRRLRRITADAMQAVGSPEAQSMDFDLAVGEAAMNAFVHTGSGTATVRISRDSGRVHVWIEDEGAGISLEHLPRATLEKGFTTAGTLGHGFKIMLKTVSRLWLLTGNQGTTVVLEQGRAKSVSP